MIIKDYNKEFMDELMVWAMPRHRWLQLEKLLESLDEEEDDNKRP